MKLPLVKMQPAAITKACVIELDCVGTPICLEKEPWQNKLQQAREDTWRQIPVRNMLEVKKRRKKQNCGCLQYR